MGNDSDDWNVGTNWSPSGVPGASDTVGLAANVQAYATGPAISFNTLSLLNNGQCLTSASGIRTGLTLSTGVVSGSTITVNSGTQLVLDTTQQIMLSGNLVMQAGAYLTHTQNLGSTRTSEINLNVGGTFNLQAGATIYADGVGYLGGAAGGVAANGPGPGGENASSSGGGGHGGAGGSGSGNTNGGAANDSAGDPVDLGSGGGAGANAGIGIGGNGGGAVLITANTLNVNGLISANGLNGALDNPNGGGGAGGSVNLNVAHLSGTGTVRANGGNGVLQSYNPSGGGGGGRVAVYVSSSETSCGLTVTASGGAAGSGASKPGQTGTIVYSPPPPSGPYSKIWAGSESNDWNVGTNWNPSGVPGASDTVGVAANVQAFTAGPAISFNTLSLINSGQCLTSSSGVSPGLTLSTGVVAGSTITVNSGSQVSLDTTQQIKLSGNLVMSSGAYMTQTSNLGSSPTSLINWSVGGTFNLQSGATIYADGLGYLGSNVAGVAGTGPGGGSVGAYGSTTSGAGHGGVGGKGTVNGGAAYDSATNPTNLGSGGGPGSDAPPSAGGNGGGAVLITAGTLNLNGLISANGINGINGTSDPAAGGGGSGGSVNLNVTNLTGTGTLQANGGNGAPSVFFGPGAGGSGGRVAIIGTFSGFMGTLHAYGGLAGSAGADNAPAGTIFTQAPGTGGTLLVDNANAVTPEFTYLSSTATSGAYTFDTIQLKRQGQIASGSNLTFSTVTLNTSFIGDLTGGATIFGNLILPGSNFTVSVSTLLVSSGVISGGAGITVSTGSVLQLQNAPNYIVPTMILQSGSVLEHLANTSSQTSWLNLQVTTLTVVSGAAITLDTLGYSNGNGNGSGAGSGNSGGGHGGAGGNGSTPSGGAVNDSSTTPTALGSGAGPTNTGASGGGAIQITSTGTVTINGSLTVRGGNGPSNAGGGAGGSINISANVFTGSGTISAVGGNGVGTGGGGGGGRICHFNRSFRGLPLVVWNRSLYDPDCGGRHER